MILDNNNDTFPVCLILPDILISPSLVLTQLVPNLWRKFYYFQTTLLIRKVRYKGSLDGSVNSVANSWFLLRSSYQGPGIKSWVEFYAQKEHRILSLPLPLPHWCALSLILKEINKYFKKQKNDAQRDYEHGQMHTWFLFLLLLLLN